MTIQVEQKLQLAIKNGVLVYLVYGFMGVGKSEVRVISDKVCPRNRRVQPLLGLREESAVLSPESTNCALWDFRN